MSVKRSNDPRKTKVEREAEIRDFVLDGSEADECPIRVLGVDGDGKCRYVDVAGRVVKLSAAQHVNQANIDALFGGGPGIEWLKSIPAFCKWHEGKAVGCKPELVRVAHGEGE